MLISAEKLAFKLYAQFEKSINSYQIEVGKLANGA